MWKCCQARSPHKKRVLSAHSFWPGTAGTDRTLDSDWTHTLYNLYIYRICSCSVQWQILMTIFMPSQIGVRQERRREREAGKVFDGGKWSSLCVCVAHVVVTALFKMHKTKTLTTQNFHATSWTTATTTTTSRVARKIHWAALMSDINGLSFVVAVIAVVPVVAVVVAVVPGLV